MINVLKKLRGKYVLRKEKLSQFVILVYNRDPTGSTGSG